MKILIAEDEAVARRLLEATLRACGYEVTVTCDGKEAWEALHREDAARLAILDWMMPRMDGVQLCKAIRGEERLKSTYIILLTSRDDEEDIVTGLTSGADDYITKPFNRQELLARLSVGIRVVELQESLALRILELEGALSHVKRLQGMLPICSYCKKIRSDDDYWQQLEEYLTEHSEAVFSHGICPECNERHVEAELKEILKGS